jgi:hypothetical protein
MLGINQTFHCELTTDLGNLGRGNWAAKMFKLLERTDLRRKGGRDLSTRGPGRSNWKEGSTVRKEQAA